MTTPKKLRDVARDAESDTHDAIWDYAEVLRHAADEIERLRACLEHTREEICDGPVDDVLWHTAIPACTTVDNITLALADGWTYDGWMQAKEEQV